MNEEKVDIGDVKVDIENEKVDIQDEKVDSEVLQEVSRDCCLSEATISGAIL